jgi:hypothetical protein
VACGVGWRVWVGMCGGCRRSRHVAANGADICNSTLVLQISATPRIKAKFHIFFCSDDGDE